MADSATYYIVQIINDLFRQESNNVGLFVFKNGDMASRFVGERLPARDMDRRKLKHLDYPDVYCQWVDYWKRTVKKHDDIPAVLKATGGNFRILRGGEIDAINGDPVDAVADYLYSLIVSEGGLVEALGPRAGISAMAPFSDEIADSFKNAGLLGADELFVPHPIKRDEIIQGKTTAHRPSYVQSSNGDEWIMEPVDFTIRTKMYAKDHAGWAAFMFKDLRERKRTRSIKTVAIVKLRWGDQDDPTIGYGLDMLTKTADVVNWLVKPEREVFLEARKQIAMAV